MNYCSKCVYPIATVNLNIDEDGVCSSCKTFEAFKKIPEEHWKLRKQKLAEIINLHKNNNSSNYDCLIPVSGGKDSYYQTHILINEFKLKPLLMTYHGNNFLPEGDYNRDRMRHVFNADHIVWGPSIDVIKKLNIIGFKKMGDMNWQNHCGIFSAPIQVAANFKIPLIFWGEINWDISGMFDPNDFIEFSARVRHEHDLRGYEWQDFVNDEKYPLNEKDMLWAKYPSDKEILEVGIRGLYIGNFYKWDPNAHTKLVQDLYGWQQARQPFERTYRMFSNLDDRYENGIHDLMKFVKFGYGRCSDHASKDIRTGYLSREEGVEKVRKYDHVVSSDLYHWLEYVGMSEDEFWSTADKFRDPRIWCIEDNQWWKENVWNERSSYGTVALSNSEIEKFNIRRKKLESEGKIL
jgi:N-acetyl sugar amidotransferase